MVNHYDIIVNRVYDRLTAYRLNAAAGDKFVDLEDIGGAVISDSHPPVRGAWPYQGPPGSYTGR